MALALTACAVGPDFKPPEAPQVAAADHPYTPVALPAQTASAPGTGGAAQRKFALLGEVLIDFELLEAPRIGGYMPGPLFDQMLDVAVVLLQMVRAEKQTL